MMATIEPEVESPPNINGGKRANSLANLIPEQGKIKNRLQTWREENPDWRMQSAASPTKQLAWKVRKNTSAGAEIIDYLLTVMRDPVESTKARITAAGMLLDRGWGKAVDTIKMLHADDNGPTDKAMVATILDKLDPSILAALQDALDSRAAVTVTVQQPADDYDEDGDEQPE